MFGLMNNRHLLIFIAIYTSFVSMIKLIFASVWC